MNPHTTDAMQYYQYILDEHQIDWYVEDGELWAADIYTTSDGKSVLKWIRALDMNVSELKRWLGY